MSEEYQLIAPTCEEQLKRWDNGQSVWTIEMGGIGPGYEQAIQILVIEIIRDEYTKPLPQTKEQKEAFGEAAIERLKDNRFSGAQVGAARSLAYQMIKIGPAETLKLVKDDRHIQVSKDWPKS